MRRLATYHLKAMSDGLNTDEQVDATKVAKRKDMDSRFLAGCMTIALMSLAVWFLTCWPFFALPVHQKSALGQAFLLGPVPALLIGLVLVRKVGLEAATALLGGSFAAGVFMYLHLGNLMLGKYAADANVPVPDYSDSWAWLVPLGWCLAVASAAFLVLPRRETQDEAGPGSSRQ